MPVKSICTSGHDFLQGGSLILSTFAADTPIKKPKNT